MFASSSSSFAAATSFKNSVVRANSSNKSVKRSSSSLVVRAEVGKGQGIIIIIV